MIQDFLADNWHEILARNGLISFEDWWQREADWFEEPNFRRGGWSGVSRIELDMANGSRKAVFLKRQENHVARTPRHPLRGISTFVREMENIQVMQASAVPSLVPVYFATRDVEGARCTVLVTEALEEYVSLDLFDLQSLKFAERLQLIRQIVEVVKHLHQQHLQHNSLYPKHLFIKRHPGGFEVRLIDLEKTRRILFRKSAMLRDLDTLNRYAHSFSRTDRLRFLLLYLEASVEEPRLRKLWRRLSRRASEKTRRRVSEPNA